jgi:hypothetical protein
MTSTEHPKPGFVTLLGRPSRRQGIPASHQYQLYRVRKEKDDTETDFREAHFDGKYPIRAEVAFQSLEELRQFKKDGRLIGVRLSPVASTPGRRPQVNMVGIKHIKGL